MTVQFISPTKRKKISQKEAAKLFLLHNGICCNCGQQIRSGEKWFIEHVDALILGGAEAADNRRPSHVEKCKAKKDAADAAARSKRDRIITKDWQREAPKLRSAPFAKAAPKRRATTPISPKFDGVSLAILRSLEANDLVASTRYSNGIFWHITPAGRAALKDATHAE